MDKCVLHTCCGPCASHCCYVLSDAGKRPVLFYSNSNISPFEEFIKRWENVKKLSGILGVEAVCDHWDHSLWLEAVKGHELDPEGGERCRLCFAFNLKRAYEFASSRGLEFTTSLTVSPYKNSKTLFEVGEAFPNFLKFDFKKKNGYKHSVELSNEYGLYRQNYCGCEFSLAQREKK